MRLMSRSLDAKVQAGAMKWKTAQNAWATVKKISADSMKSKLDAIRVRKDNPSRDVEGPDRGEQTAKQYIFPSEFQRFVSCEEVPLPWRRILALAVYLYPRASELRALAWEDVDLVHGTVHVHRSVDRDSGAMKGTKTKAARRFAIEPALLPLLKALHEQANGKGLVIELPCERDMARGLRLWLKKAGIDRAELHEATPTRKAMTFHNLRATGITWMAIRGDEPVHIMRRAGHTDFVTTQGYIREAEAVRVGFGEPFPALPAALLRGTSTAACSTRSGGPVGGVRKAQPESRAREQSKGS